MLRILSSGGHRARAPGRAGEVTALDRRIDSRGWLHVGLGLMLLAVGGCVDSDQDGANNLELGTNDPTSGRKARAPGWATGAEWRLEEDLRLGVVEGTGPEQFGQIRSVVSDSRGWIYVSEGHSEEIRVFDADGEFSHAIGGRGSGPGEFQFARKMLLQEGDTLWVVDTQAQRYSVFAPDGSFLDSHPRRILSGNTSGTTLLFDGRLLDWEMTYPDGTFGPRLRQWPILVSEDFRTLDSLPFLEFRQKMMPDGRIPQVFFGGELLVATDRSGSIWFADTREYRIYRRTLRGDTMTVLELVVDPAPVGEVEREYLRREFGRTSLSRYLDDLPETKPIIHGIYPDGRGHVFVFPETADARAGTVVDVFRERGEYLGRMALPTPPARVSRRVAFRAYAAVDHLLVVFHDELDVPHVARLRIIKDE